MGGQRAGAARWRVAATTAVLAMASTGCGYLLYPAPRPARMPHVDGGHVEVMVDREGRTVMALYLPAPSPSAPTVVLFHGNGQQLADVAPLAGWLHHAGLGAYVPEYPGYGLTPEPSSEEASLYASAQRALDHLHGELQVPPAQTHLLGQSLGCGVATEMAARGHGARLALLSPYTRITAVADRFVPVLPASWLTSDRYDIEGRAPRIGLPVLLIHGTRDEIIPPDMTRTLAGRFPKAEVRWIDGAGHNNLFDDPATLASLLAFFKG